MPADDREPFVVTRPFRFDTGAVIVQGSLHCWRAAVRQHRACNLTRLPPGCRMEVGGHRHSRPGKGVDGFLALGAPVFLVHHLTDAGRKFTRVCPIECDFGNGILTGDGFTACLMINIHGHTLDVSGQSLARNGVLCDHIHRWQGDDQRTERERALAARGHLPQARTLQLALDDAGDTVKHVNLCTVKTANLPSVDETGNGISDQSGQIVDFI